MITSFSPRRRVQLLGAVAWCTLAACLACRPKPTMQQVVVTPATITPFWDSLVRAVPMDSAGRLLRAMVQADQPKPIARELQCELSRLGYTRGEFAVATAYQRMRDTLFKKEDQSALLRLNQRMAGAMGGISMADCHLPLDLPRVADSLNRGPQSRVDTIRGNKNPPGR